VGALGGAIGGTEPNGSLNTAVGASAGWRLIGDNNIDIGNVGNPADSNTIRIGTVVQFTDPFFPNLVQPVHTATYIAGISGQTASGGVAVYINPDGKLGTLISSARFKDGIKLMDKASEAILALKPVTFRYRKELDPDGIPQFGLVAEDVEKVSPDLVVRDKDGEVMTVRYEAVNAMLLNEFLKVHRKVQRLEAALAAVNERLKEQDAKINKVNAKVELTKPVPRVANNGQ
jgi:Chaperone of endosialidase